jgi:hypothetical protein
MSFNTSNIQSDTFSGVYSISAPIHYVDGIPISNNAGNLKLGDESNTIVECLELQSGTSVSGPLGEFDLVQTTGIIAQAGEGEEIIIYGPLNMQDKALKNLYRLTLAGNVSGNNNQLLGADVNGNLQWTERVDGSQWSNYPALIDVDLNDKAINNLQALTVSNGAGTNGQVLSVDGSGFAVWKDDVNASLWSNYPAGSEVDVANYGLSNVSYLTLANGVGGLENQVLSVDAVGALKWKTDANDVANWSNYNAVSTVNLGAQSLNGAYDKGEGINVITDFLMNNNSITGVNNIGASLVQSTNLESTNAAIGNITSVQSITGNIFVGGFTINKLNNITLGDAGVVGLENQVISVNSSGSLVWKDDANDASQWATFDAVQDVNMNNFSLNSVNNINCQKIECVYALENVLYVSPNGSDSGKGNIESPYATIQHAITAYELSGSTVYSYIMIMAGNYAENLTITKKINLVGLATSPFSASVGCCVNGNISINIGTNGGDMFNNAVNISGLLVSGQVSFTSTANSILNLDNCFIYSPNNTSGRGLYFNPSSTNSRLRITNTQINSGGTTGLDPLIEITSVSSVTMNNCIFSAKGLQNVLKFSGTATCDTINVVKFENSNTGANVPALVEISATVSGTYTFSNCGFLYSSTTSKSSNANASGILSSSSSGNNQIVVLYCSFFLFGTSSVQNYAIQDANFGTAQAMIVIYYMSSASLQNAFAIHAILNTNKFQLQIVS